MYIGGGQMIEAPYTGAHVVSQLQLLLFSGLAFFVLLPVLKRTLTITLDCDWCYRRLAPAFWNHLMYPVMRALGEVRDGFTGHLPDDIKRFIYSPPQEGMYFREWGLGGAMLTITGILFIYLVLGFAP